MRQSCKISMIIFLLPLLVFLPIDSRAEFLKLKDRRIELVEGAVGTAWDKEHKEKALEANAMSEAGVGDSLQKVWSYASSYMGQAIAALRGIDYREFRIKAEAPPGSKVECNFRIDYECHGYINKVTFALADSRYYLKINTGILAENMVDWDRPALGKTLYSATNDLAPGEWAVDLAQEIAIDQAQDLLTDKAVTAAAAYAGASSAVAEAVSTGAGIAIGTAINVIMFVADAFTTEFAVSDNKSVDYKKIWLKTGKTYRTFISVDTRAVAVGLKVGMTLAYVDFFNHGPHFGDDDGKRIPRRGFCLKKVVLTGHGDEIVLPNDYFYPIVESTHLSPDKSFVNQKQEMELAFYNKGKKESVPCNVRVDAPEGGEPFDFTLEPIPAGQTYRHKFEHTFAKPGQQVFTVTVDTAGALDKYIDLTHKKEYKVFVGHAIDLAFLNPKIVRQAGGETFWENDKIFIKGAVKNNGDMPCDNAYVSVKRGVEVTSGVKEEIGRIGVGEEKQFTISGFLIGREVALEVEPRSDIEELDKENNRCKISVTLTRAHPEIRVKHEDFKMSPADPKLGDQFITFKVPIENAGNTMIQSIKGRVVIDGKEVIKEFTIRDFAPGAVVQLNDVVWKITKPDMHNFFVDFLEGTLSSTYKRTYPLSNKYWDDFRLSFKVRPGLVEGIWLDLMPSELRYDEDKRYLWYAIYSKGDVKCYVDAKLYIVYGDGTSRKLKAGEYRHEIWPGEKTVKRYFSGILSGNYKYKIDTEIALPEDLSKIPTHQEHKELVYTCKEFRADEDIGPNPAIVAVTVAFTRNDYPPWPRDKRPPAWRDWEPYLYKDGKAYYIHIGIIAANMGSVPCPKPSLECMLLDADRPDRIPRFEDMPGYKPDAHRTWFYADGMYRNGMIAPPEGPFPVRVKNMPDSPAVRDASRGQLLTEPFEGEMAPRPTEWILDLRGARAGMGSLLYCAGNYLFKGMIDPEGIVKNDVHPEDNTVTMRFSIPDLISKLGTDKKYIFLVKKDLPAKAIEALEGWNKREKEHGRPQEAYVIMQASPEYGFK
ncbi:MAG: hypothetical protein V1927_03360 [Candidatus Omnitrophota bacterium]